MEKRKLKKVVSLILLGALLISACFNVLTSVVALNTTSKAIFTYGDAIGATTLLGEDFELEADESGNIVLPDNKTAKNLIWKNGDKLYRPGKTVNIAELGETVTFNAYFAGARFDYSDICTANVSLAGGAVSENLFKSLSRNKKGYWRVPKGLSNTTADEYGYYGLALGHDRLGIVPSQGVGSSKALALRTNANGSTNLYRAAALFGHTPTTFTTNSTIEYSYAYYTPNTEYTIEFDYKTVTSVSATIAFGVNTDLEITDSVASVTVNSASFGSEGTFVTLAPTNGEWKHASVKVTSPSTYIGNGINSARVGIAVKDNEASTSSVRYNYFDNVEFYPTEMGGVDFGTKVYFKYGEAEGVTSAIGEDFIVYADDDESITLPTVESALNLLWKHGDKLYRPGKTLSIDKLGDDLTFTAYFAGTRLGYDSICTDNVALAGGSINENLFKSLSRNKKGYWRVPKGLSNTTADEYGYYGLALGHDRFGIIPSQGVGSSKALALRTNANGNYNLYRAAALFGHTPTTFTTNSTIEYSYAYYTPNTEYTIEFDYKTVTSVSATIAFGVNTDLEITDSVASVTVNSASFGSEGTFVTLAPTNGEWKHASVKVTSPSTYIGNGINSARVGIAVKDNEASTSSVRYNYFDNVEFYPTEMGGVDFGTKVVFTYGNAQGAASAMGEDTIIYLDEDDEKVTLPSGNAMNLLWKLGDDLYEPGTEFSVKGIDKSITFTAYFGAASMDYENICTNTVTLGGGDRNLYEELSRAKSYWKVPQGLSNTTPDGSGRYGLALGHDRMGIINNVGKSGKGLRLRTNVNTTMTQHYIADLFRHDPTSFNTSGNITYSYVYYAPDTEYTVEFDYKTYSEVNAAVAFGVDQVEGNDSSGTKSVNADTFGSEDNGVTLPSTNGEWKHISMKVTSPSSYVGGGVTSARVGLAIKDNEANGDSIRYNYFDNVIFYPETFTPKTLKVINGAETCAKESRTISYFKVKEPLKYDYPVILPDGNSIVACIRTGVNGQGVAWDVSHGKIINFTGWKLSGGDKIYPSESKISSKNLKDDSVLSAVYGDATADFNNLSNDFVFFTANQTSYGSQNARIMGESDKYVNITGVEGQNNSWQQVLVFSEKEKFYAYNPGKTYMISFKYRRTDNESADSQLFVNFGAIPWGWRAASGGVKRIVLGQSKKGMTDFETVTAYVTAPDNYTYSSGGDNPEYFYSKTIGIGAGLSNGVSIDFDDIKVTEVNFDDKNTNTATLDYGSSKDFSDTQTVKFTDTICLPIQQNSVASRRTGTNKEGKNWAVNHGQISNHTAWYCKNNGVYYEPGETVSVDEVGKNPTFIAIYDGGKVDFNNISNDFKFFTNNETSYAFANAKIVGSDNKYVNLTGTEKENKKREQVLLFTNTNKFLGYNTGKTYKLTFKYRRTDNKDVESNLFFNFGAIPWGWRAENGCVSRVTIGKTKKGMKDFETVTAYVTAPDTYLYYADGKSPEYFYSRTMGLGAELSNGVSVDFDDILIEPLGRDQVAVTFSVPSENQQKIAVGRAGNKLTVPDMDIDKNKVIEGWYTDKDFKNAFSLKTFPKNSMTVYGKTVDAKVRYYGFVDYPWDDSVDEKGKYARQKRMIPTKGFSSDGDGYALRIANTDSEANQEQQCIALPIGVKANTKYLISYDFYYEQIGDKSASQSNVWFNTSVTAKAWQGVMEHVTTSDEYIPANIKEKKWYTGYVYGTTTEYTWSNRLVLMVRVPVGSIRYIDNLIITELSEDENVVLWKLGSFQSPKPTVAKKNSTIKVIKPTMEGNYAFLNWTLNNEDYKKDTYVVEEDTIFVAKTTTNKFDEGFENTYYGKNGITSYGMDLDWEIYDSSGGNAGNVKSGRYSLHKIGKDIRNGAYCLHHNSFVTEYSMAEGQIYTASFWVKIENPVHKLGSIEIASCISLGNPWDFPSDRFSVAPVADIADGEWHELKFTFLASGPYLSVVVPGNLSVYIDDVTVVYSPDAEKSESCKFEEYIPAPLVDGKYIKPMADEELGEFKLVKRTEETSAISSGISTPLIIVICAAIAVVLAGAAVFVLLFIRKRKSGR